MYSICFIFKINSFFSEALFDASVSYHSYANIDFKNSIIAIKLYIVMI